MEDSVETKNDVVEITEEDFNDICRCRIRELSDAIDTIVHEARAFDCLYVQAREDRKRYMLKYFSSDEGLFFEKGLKKYMGF
jgi:hypothetical protein